MSETEVPTGCGESEACRLVGELAALKKERDEWKHEAESNAAKITAVNGLKARIKHLEEQVEVEHRGFTRRRAEKTRQWNDLVAQRDRAVASCESMGERVRVLETALRAVDKLVRNAWKLSQLLDCTLPLEHCPGCRMGHEFGDILRIVADVVDAQETRLDGKLQTCVDALRTAWSVLKAGLTYVGHDVRSLAPNHRAAIDAARSARDAALERVRVLEAHFQNCAECSECAFESGLVIPGTAVDAPPDKANEEPAERVRALEVVAFHARRVENGFARSKSGDRVDVAPNGTSALDGFELFDNLKIALRSLDALSTAVDAPPLDSEALKSTAMDVVRGLCRVRLRTGRANPRRGL